MNQPRTNQAKSSTADKRAALGFRAHSGWAAVVAVGGHPGSPTVLDRRRIELADPDIAGSKQPYHAAEELDLKQAEKLLSRCTDASQRMAAGGLRVVIDELRSRDYQVAGAGLPLASGRPVPALAAILASHALIHAAEGQLFRDVLARASEQAGLAVTQVKERELYDRAAAELGMSDGQLREHLADLGKSIGPPWREDEKLATLAGWLVLARASK
jgi:hypothetical protein